MRVGTEYISNLLNHAANIFTLASIIRLQSSISRGRVGGGAGLLMIGCQNVQIFNKLCFVF